jgi:hypothetical protein
LTEEAAQQEPSKRLKREELDRKAEVEPNECKVQPKNGKDEPKKRS